MIDGIVYRAVCKRAEYHCEYPFCTRRNIELHHKKKRSQGGKDTEDNLVALCTEHHVQVHNTPKMFWANWNKLTINNKTLDNEQENSV